LFGVSRMTARGELESWGEPGAGNPEALERLQAATQRAATQGSGKKCNRFSKELNQRKDGRTQKQSAGTRSRGSVPTPRGVYRIREPREESKRRREGQAEWKVSVRSTRVCVCFFFFWSKDRKKRKTKHRDNGQKGIARDKIAKNWRGTTPEWSEGPQKRGDERERRTLTWWRGKNCRKECGCALRAGVTESMDTAGRLRGVRPAWCM
jgi:hypothetical protein